MLPRAVKTSRLATLTLSLAVPLPALGQYTPPPYPGTAKDVVIGTGIGVALGLAALYFLNAPEHHLKGCIIESPIGVRLQEFKQNAVNLYALERAPEYLRPGEFVKLRGYRGPKAPKGEIRTFQVSQVEKRYGACPVTPPTRAPTP